MSRSRPLNVPDRMLSKPFDGVRNRQHLVADAERICELRRMSSDTCAVKRNGSITPRTLLGAERIDRDRRA